MKLPTVGRVREVWREQGVRGIWFRTWDVLGYRRLIILRRPLDAPITNHIATVPVSVDWLTPAQLPELLAERGSADAPEFQARWQRGHRCLAARVEGRLVATMWAATGPAWLAYFECEFVPATAEAYLFDAYTDPQFRGQGIAPLLSNEWMRRLRDEGYRWAIRLTLPENRAALRAHAKVGFEPVGMLRRIKLGPWQRVWRRP